jgi:hypothetical protein
MRRLVALAGLLVVLVLLVVAQLVLPGIAAQQLTDRLKHSGQGVHVSVSAFPGIELLWHQADKVVVRMARYRSSTGNLSGQLGQSSDVDTLDATVGELDTGLLTLRNATLHKRGDQLTGSATVTEAALRAAVPFLDAVKPVASGNGRLTLRGTATVLGVSATADATVQTENGQLVVVPDLPFGGLATVTVFSSPHVAVTGVSAAPDPAGFRVSADGRLR